MRSIGQRVRKFILVSWIWKKRHLIRVPREVMRRAMCKLGVDG